VKNLSELKRTKERAKEMKLRSLKSLKVKKNEMDPNLNDVKN
jgi:hypothetical protein